ncbi:MAG: acylphosphatase, partial [Bacteroidales bacterium]|nr:acylphosphatase [Bacteroidales bacterium]
MSRRSVRVTVRGLVQGVGFRPFVFRIAVRSGLSGWVQNTNENVTIEVTGTVRDIDSFINLLRREAPPAAMIESISVADAELRDFTEFTILRSHDLSDEITEISPDIS